MDRITETLLKEFAGEHALTSLPPWKQFEHFSSYAVVRREHSETFDTNDIVVGHDSNDSEADSGEDTHIDGIAILVNGTMMTDLDEFKELSENSSRLEVSFIFIQSDIGAHFDAAKIGSFGFGVLDFFKDQPGLNRNAGVAAMAEIQQAIFQKGTKFKPNPICKMYYVTTGTWTGVEPTLNARIEKVKSDLQKTGLFQSVEFTPVAADRLQILYRRTKHPIATEFEFPNKITVKPALANVSQAYIGFLPWPEFRKLIVDEAGNLLRGLFFDNVRDWQGYNKVNTDIKTTLVSNDRNRFILMNNGVTIITKELRTLGDKMFMEDYQIVNGCQTSNVLFEQRKVLDETVTVPVRIIHTVDEVITNAIIKAANWQTDIKEEQLFALQEYPKQLEAFFATYPEPQRLYYERRSGQYDALPIEKTRIMTFANTIKAFASMFLNEPHRATKNYAGIKAKVGKDIFSKGQRMEVYYVAALALYKLEYLFRNRKLGPEYKPARFHILLAIRLIIAGYDMPRMKAKKMEAYANKMAKILNDPAKSEIVITRAAEAVKLAAAGAFERDSIRTEPFTKKVIEQTVS